MKEKLSVVPWFQGGISFGVSLVLVSNTAYASCKLQIIPTSVLKLNSSNLLKLLDTTITGQKIPKILSQRRDEDDESDYFLGRGIDYPVNLTAVNPSTRELINQLKQVSEGLLWMSESEYPFEVLWWEQSVITPQQLLQLTNHAPDLPVKVIGLDQFFNRAVAPADWHNQEERETVERYQVLVDTLKIYLSDIQVYCVGVVEVDIYIVGSSKSGNLVGLSTKSVES
ncbi:MAG: hypothetical protein F6K58_06090 [Symploca sp. SIO2E9]|nr:hypothetical protein [Symploca sp. SIO2E9]